MNTSKETAARAASWALSKVGCPYSQARRTQPGVFDCSSLVARAYAAQGKKWKYGGSVPISCKAAYDDDFELVWPASYAEIGRKMGGKDVIAKATQPGDVQYLCTDSSTSRKNRITHVAMVAGKGKIVHARGTKYGVVTSSINLYAGKVCAVVRYNPDCVLRKGMKGWRTLALQKALIARGYDVDADGEYGSKTANAVKAYQALIFLPVTGEADQATRDVLYTSVSHKASSPIPAASPIAPGKSSKIEVTGSTVNLRTGPGTDYPIERLVHQGDVLETVDMNRWIPVLSDGKILWISARYARQANGQMA